MWLDEIIYHNATAAMVAEIDTKGLSWVMYKI